MCSDTLMGVFYRFALCLVIFAPLSVILVVEAASPGSSTTMVESLRDEVTFYLSFDQKRLVADLAAGDAEPAEIHGTPKFADGVHGHALVLGGENAVRAEFLPSGNIDFSVPGALSFWLAPLKWRQPGEVEERQTLGFLGLRGSSGGAFFIQRHGFKNEGGRPIRNDAFQIGVYNLPDWENVIYSRAADRNRPHFTEQWEPLDWRLIVVNWDSNGYSVSIDADHAERRDYPRAISEIDFPNDLVGKRRGSFRLGGSPSLETTLIDEVTVYRRPLEGNEIQALYDARR